MTQPTQTRSAVLTAVMMAVTASGAMAQTPADSAHLDSLAQQARNVRCWRARPMPECRMIFLTDIGIEFPVRSSRSPTAPAVWQRHFSERLNWSIGLMRNGNRHAHGVSLSLLSEDLSAFPMLAEYRYRYWMRGGQAIDASLGLRRTAVWTGPGVERAKGYSTMLGYTPTRWVGATVRYDHVAVRGQPFTALSLGIQSTRVSEYAFRFMALAIVDGLLAKIGIERGEE